MAARRCSTTSTCRARWAGSPASTRCVWMPGRSISARRWRAVPALGRALKRIKEQLRAVPGPWARLRAAALSQRARPARSLPGLPVPQIGFNYLGRFAARGAGGLGARRRGGGAGRRRRSGDAAGARARGQCADAWTGRRGRGCRRAGRGRERCCREAEVRATGAELVCRAGGAGAPCRRSPAPAAARPRTCRWWRCRRARSSGWRGRIRGSRTSAAVAAAGGAAVPCAV